MPSNNIQLKIIKPSPQLSDFVESFWMLANHSESAHEIVVLPDGRFDILFSYSSKEPYHALLRGLDTEPGQNTIPPKSVMFAISFKLLAIEYLLHLKVASVINEGLYLPNNFWNITIQDLNNFETFCDKASAKMRSLINAAIDKRKQKLFELIYSSNGSMSVKELSEKVFWSSS
jgi:hypothetical protein